MHDVRSNRQHPIVAAAIALTFHAGTSAADREADEGNEDSITAEQILANPLEDSAYTLKDRCLATARYRRIEIVGDMALAFHGRGDDLWLNVLPRRCRGLRTNMVLILEQSSLRLCARDQFRGVSPGSSATRTSICTLGSFERMAPERFHAMRDALIAQQNTKTTARTVRASERGHAETAGEAGG